MRQCPTPFFPIIIPDLYIVHGDLFHHGSKFHHTYPVKVRMSCTEYTHPTSLQFPTMPHLGLKRARYALRVYLACPVPFPFVLSWTVLFLSTSPSLFFLQPQTVLETSVILFFAYTLTPVALFADAFVQFFHGPSGLIPPGIRKRRRDTISILKPPASRTCSQQISIASHRFGKHALQKSGNCGRILELGAGSPRCSLISSRVRK